MAKAVNMKHVTPNSRGINMKPVIRSVGYLLLIAFTSPCWATDDELIEKGRYMATASDCIACHTGPNGQYFAGGLPFDTPFGTIYSPNITPDKKHGIGNYTSDQFHAALTKGIRGDGARLYPAMPFTSYHYITREDCDAMYAYFMSIRPVPRQNTENKLMFPFNIRASLIFWDMLFLSDAKFSPDKKHSAEWNRGKYLVEGPGHCGECHTPRNLMFAMEQDKPLQGAMLGNSYAANITENELLRKKWTRESLLDYFKSGSAHQGSAFGAMNEVIFHSTQNLTEADNAAIAEYLMNSGIMTPIPTQPVATVSLSPAEAASGTSLYFANCAGCHGDEGEGKPNVAPPLDGNATVAALNPFNLIASILGGVPTHRYTPENSFYAMPGFADLLSNDEITDLSNFMRMTWSGIPQPITPGQVQSIREKLK